MRMASRLSIGRLKAPTVYQLPNAPQNGLPCPKNKITPAPPPRQVTAYPGPTVRLIVVLRTTLLLLPRVP